MSTVEMESDICSLDEGKMKSSRIHMYEMEIFGSMKARDGRLFILLVSEKLHEDPSEDGYTFLQVVKLEHSFSTTLESKMTWT